MNRDMRKTRKQIVTYVSLGVVIALLAGYILLRRPDRMTYDLPELGSVDASAIKEITIEQPGQEQIEIRREGEVWLVGPLRYRGDPAAIDAMAETVSAFRLSDLVSTSKNYERYELSDSSAIVVTVRDSEAEIRRFLVGKTAPSMNHTYVRIGDNQNVYHAVSNLRRIFDKDVSSLRDRQILKFDENDVIRIDLLVEGWALQIVKPTGTVSTTSQSGSDVAWTGSDGSTWTQDRLNDVFREISDLRCTSFSDAKLSEMAEPLLTVRAAAQSEVSLSIHENTEQGYLTSSSETPYLFFISEQIGDTLLEFAAEARGQQIPD